ncbi:MAG: tRNA uridine-5-carboxymethylaminomethyl(34) synthesis GTPase MnmE [Dokdonella sp.]
MDDHGDTIVAIATAAGIGGIGVLRISGAKAPMIAERLLGRKAKPRHAHFMTFRDGDDAVIDHGLLLHFPGPRSYTGEHVVELQGHGSPVVLRQLQHRVVELGARLARAGEFSERAFLNGKFDLAQAEAVADLISSGSQAAATAALRSLDGEFSRRVQTLLEAVIRQRVWIEAAIDFPEEEIDFLADTRLALGFDELNGQTDALLAAARRGLRLNNGLHAVIIGRPNAGKSSLLNALVASDRAIVTDQPGTTRDVLRETINLDGIALTLVDTAGLRDSTDCVEQEGIRRTHEELERADLTLLVTEEPGELSEYDAFLRYSLKSESSLIVHNKSDKYGIAPRAEVIDGFRHLWLSARNGDGLQLLVDELQRRAGQSDSQDGAFTARARHVAALQRARGHLLAATHALTEIKAGELAAEELRQVQHAFGEITGEFRSDDLLGEIFGSFCIGK